MKLSISNIAWDAEFDEQMYIFLERNSFEGLEIAPTRIWSEEPYSHVNEAKEYRKSLWEKYHLKISSMQSIWYGRSERVFGEKEEREKLIEYSKSAFEFAEVLGCENLVFGCPRNRNIFEGCTADVTSIAVDFFRKLAELAQKHHTVLSMEANPPIYNTNYINQTEDAVALIRRIDSKGFRLNYDLGTVIQNKEQIGQIREYVSYINHVHISEPGLAPIQVGDLQRQLYDVLREMQYERYVSIEMGNLKDISKVKEICIKLNDLTRG